MSPNKIEDCLLCTGTVAVAQTRSTSRIAAPLVAPFATGATARQRHPRGPLHLDSPGLCCAGFPQGRCCTACVPDSALRSLSCGNRFCNLKGAHLGAPLDSDGSAQGGGPHGWGY